MIRRARLVPGIHDFYLFDDDVLDEGVGGRKISGARRRRSSNGCARDR